MKIGELATLIPEIYHADRSSLLFLGPPGIGKSTGVNEAARIIANSLNKECVDYSDQEAERILADPDRYFVHVDFRLTEAEPSDFLGIPRERNGAVMYHPLLWAMCLSKASGILFLDELTNVQRLDVISATYKIVLDRRAGFTKFSDSVMVIAAGNSPEESTVANLLPAPLIDRLIIYPIEPASVLEWAGWMDLHHEHDWDRRVLAYLSHFKDDFLRLPSEQETLENFPTPRSFTKLAKLSRKITSGEHFRATSLGTLGPVIGEKFFAFLKTDVPSPQELIASPDLFRSLPLDAQYLASVVVGTYLGETPGDQKRIEREAEHAVPLLKAMGGISKEYVVLTLISCGEVKIRVANTVIQKEKSLRDALKDLAEFANEIGGL